MNIQEAKEQIEQAVRIYLMKDEYGDYRIPIERQRPVFLLGAPGIGKTAVMEQIAQEMDIALVSYSMTHHTRQSALGLPFISHKKYQGAEFDVSEYTMSEIVASVYETMEATGKTEGILFLDEINSMELNVQAKILKAIEEKQVVRLGGYEPIKTDIKVISAVNERPMDCVKAGKLREDLFYRLSVVQVNIPPLRERRDDILYMANRFIETYNQSMRRDIMGLDEQVEKLFRNYAWPGNVRELKNIIEGAFNVASTHFIQKKDLPEYLANPVRFEVARTAGCEKRKIFS